MTPGDDVHNRIKARVRGSLRKHLAHDVENAADAAFTPLRLMLSHGLILPIYFQICDDTNTPELRVVRRYSPASAAPEGAS